MTTLHMTHKEATKLMIRNWRGQVYGLERRCNEGELTMEEFLKLKREYEIRIAAAQAVYRLTNPFGHQLRVEDED